jgi:hypothetical protein
MRQDDPTEFWFLGRDPNAVVRRFAISEEVTDNSTLKSMLKSTRFAQRFKTINEKWSSSTHTQFIETLFDANTRLFQTVESFVSGP